MRWRRGGRHEKNGTELAGMDWWFSALAPARTSEEL